jgi:hypothetical protein
MANKIDRERTSDGSVSFPRITPEMNSRLNEIVRTYVFQRLDQSSGFHRHIFDYFNTPEGNPKSDESAVQEGFVVETIYERLQPPVKIADSSRQNKLRRFAEKYFKEVIPIGYYFEGRNQTKHLDWKYHKVLLDKITHHSITGLTNEYGLQEYYPFILQILAQAQNEYIDKIVFLERPEKRKELKEIDNQVDTLINILKRFDTKAKPVEEIAQIKSIDEIVFRYKSDVLKVSSPTLVHGIMSGLLEHFSAPPSGNWEFSVSQYASIIKEQFKNYDFKERLTIAIHNWLTKESIIPLNGKAKTADKALRFIAEFIKIAGIPFEGKATALGDEVRILRNYINRKNIIRHQEEFTIEPDHSRLKKHFPAWFFKLTTKFKTEKEMETAVYIASRFNLWPILTDLATIAEVLTNLKKVPHFDTYVIPGIHQDGKEIPDVESFIRLFESVKPSFSIMRPIPLTSLSFTLQGSKNNYQINQAIPLSLIQKALKEYAHNHPEDLSFDLVAQEHYYKEEGDVFPHVKHKNEFNPLDKRFFPIFCRDFYNYLLEFSPPQEREAFPKHRYIPIIAVMIIKCMSDEIHDAPLEAKMIEKVSDWYELSRNNQL